MIPAFTQYLHTHGQTWSDMSRCQQVTAWVCFLREWGQRQNWEQATDKILSEHRELWQKMSER